MGNLHGLHRSHHHNSPFPPSPAPPSSYSPSAPHMTVEPYCGVDSSLRCLAGKAEGFGRGAVGGLNGPICHVTSLAGKLPLSVLFYCIFLLIKFKFRTKQVVIFCIYT